MAYWILSICTCFWVKGTVLLTSFKKIVLLTKWSWVCSCAGRIQLFCERRRSVLRSTGNKCIYVVFQLPFLLQQRNYSTNLDFDSADRCVTLCNLNLAMKENMNTTHRESRTWFRQMYMYGFFWAFVIIPLFGFVIIILSLIFLTL